MRWLVILILLLQAAPPHPQVWPPSGETEAKGVTPIPAPVPACPCSDTSNPLGTGGPVDQAYAMTTAKIDALAALCTSNGGTPSPSCPATYSMSLFCIGGSNPGTYGYWEVLVGTGDCDLSGWTTPTPNSGSYNAWGVYDQATQDDLDVCVQQIVNASVYPGACPKP